MADGNDLKLDSLRSMASHFRKQGALSSKGKEDQQKEEDLPALPERTQQELDDAEEFEEYIEFPRLEKFKTYRSEDIRPRHKNIPPRKTEITFKNCDVKVALADVQFFESVPLHSDLQPFVLKNSHATFSDLDSCDKIIFCLDDIGNTVLLVEKDDQREEINLGSIVRFEFCRPQISSLVVNSGDVKGDVAVLGAPCHIQREHPLRTSRCRTLATSGAMIPVSSADLQTSPPTTFLSHYAWTQIP